MAYLAGRWPEARALAVEGHELALQTGERPQQALALSGRALVGACEGRVSMPVPTPSRRSRSRASTGWRWGGSTPLGARAAGRVARPARGRGRAAGARARAPAGGRGRRARLHPLRREEIEALIALGRLYEAEAVLGWLSARARARARLGARRGLAVPWAARRRSPRPGGSAGGVRPRAARAQARGVPFERARTELCLGAAQRRAGQRRNARATLETARGTFAALAARPWAVRAEAELRRIGGRRSSGDEFTPAPRRVAEHVARGESNKQVAATLYLSPKTVEGHLRSIFRKLSMHSGYGPDTQGAERAEIGDFIVSGPPRRA